MGEHSSIMEHTLWSSSIPHDAKYDKKAVTGQISMSVLPR